MSQTTYAVPSRDDLLEGHDSYWHGALAALNTPAVDQSAISLVMPYFAAQRAYDRHVEACPTCSEGDWFADECAEGSALASIASDACAAQEDLALQN